MPVYSLFLSMLCEGYAKILQLDKGSGELQASTKRSSGSFH